jgi:hypothetical protein
MYVDGAAVNLTAGVYTGNTLAQEIQTPSVPITPLPSIPRHESS